VAKRNVVESARIVIRSDDGNRLEINGKGDAAESMFTGFYCLGEARRAKLLERMQAVHAEMLAKSSGATHD